MQFIKRFHLLVMPILFLCLSSVLFSFETLKMEEYQVKSIFLYKLCCFTTWPEETTWDPARPLVISVLGTLPPGGQIQLVGKKKIGKRRLEIKYIQDIKEIERSDVLFIASSEKNRIDKILEYVAKKPILTVGDTPGFGHRGVIVNMFIKDKNMGYEINPSALKKADLILNTYFFQNGIIVNTATSAHLGHMAGGNVGETSI